MFKEFKRFKGFTWFRFNGFTACAVLAAWCLLIPVHAQQAPTATATASLAAAPDQQFTSGEATIRYRDIGSGAPIVFIHGYAGNLETLIGTANALPAANRKVALDVRGFGKSSKFGDAAKFGQRMVDDVVQLMDHLKIPRAHLVGHSMGALIAANVAARYPDRVSSAALVAGPFWGEPEITTETRRWTSELEGGRGLVSFLLWISPGMSPQMAASLNAGMLKSNDLPSLTEVMRSLPALSITSLPTDGNKVLLVAGTSDPLFPLSTAFAKRTSGAKMLEIQGGDHISVITNADAVKAMTAQLRP
jgi:pimeloyl-ACP methyl ester carboxylesterase